MVVGGLVARSCPTLCNPMNSSPPGSSGHGISQPRIMGWLLFPSPGDLPDPGIKLISLYWQVDSLPLSNLESPTWTRESSYGRHKAFKPVISLWDQSHLRKYLFFFFLELLKTFIYLFYWRLITRLYWFFHIAKEAQMYRTVFWTLWERERVGRFGRMALKQV